MSKVPEFNGQGPKPTQLAVGIALVKYYAAWPYRLITSTQADVPAPTTLLDPVEAKGYPDVLISRLGVGQVRGSQLVDMTFDSADPEFAARAANAFAEEYVAHNLSLKVRIAREERRVADGRSAEAGRPDAARATSRWRSTRKRRTPARSTATRTSSSRG